MSHRDKIKLFRSDGIFKKHIDPTDVRSMEARGEIEALYEERGRNPHFIGYIERKGGIVSGSDHSVATITMSESIANAGGYGRSRTLGLSDERRARINAARANGPLPDADFIERALTKISDWHKIHDDRAVVICAGRVCQPTKNAAKA